MYIVVLAEYSFSYKRHQSSVANSFSKGVSKKLHIYIVFERNDFETNHVKLNSATQVPPLPE